jgi:spore germination protein KB
MEKISTYQLFSMLVLFQIGSTVVFGFAADAGKDAWIVTLLSNILGSFLILLYLMLMRMHPGMTLVQWFPSQFGRWFGIPVAWFYPLAFIYVAGRVLRDFAEMITSTVLPETPLWVILISFSLVIAYGLYAGIEPIGRLGGFFFPTMVVMTYLVLIILLISSGIVDLRQLLPILDHGWSTVWKSLWPLNVTVPYGETIVFAMIWPLVNQQKHIPKVTWLATAFYGFLMVMGDVLAIASLGEGIVKRSVFPFYVLVRQINVAEFIQNLDVIVVLQFGTIGFFKIVLFMFGAIRGIQQLTGLANSRRLILPAVTLLAVASQFMATNISEHLYIGLKIVPHLLWIPLFIALPLLLFMVTWIRMKRSMKKRRMADVA